MCRALSKVLTTTLGQIPTSQRRRRLTITVEQKHTLSDRANRRTQIKTTRAHTYSHTESQLRSTHGPRGLLCPFPALLRRCWHTLPYRQLFRSRRSELAERGSPNAVQHCVLPFLRRCRHYARISGPLFDLQTYFPSKFMSFVHILMVVCTKTLASLGIRAQSVTQTVAHQ